MYATWNGKEEYEKFSRSDRISAVIKKMCRK
jgi:hypothetical protein